MNETIKMVLVLLIVSVISAVSLTLVYQKTSPIIEKNKQHELNVALKEILSEATKFEEINLDFSGTDIITAYKGLKNNEVIGYVFLSETPGFQGYIKVLVGTDTQQIINVKILEHLETPGLGSRITQQEFLKQFQNSEIINYDSITGATISSSAVITSIKETQDYILKLRNTK